MRSGGPNDPLKWVEATDEQEKVHHIVISDHFPFNSQLLQTSMSSGGWCGKITQRWINFYWWPYVHESALKNFRLTDQTAEIPPKGYEMSVFNIHAMPRALAGPRRWVVMP